MRHFDRFLAEPKIDTTREQKPVATAANIIGGPPQKNVLHPTSSLSDMSAPSMAKVRKGANLSDWMRSPHPTTNIHPELKLTDDLYLSPPKSMVFPDAEKQTDLEHLQPFQLGILSLKNKNSYSGYLKDYTNIYNVISHMLCRPDFKEFTGIQIYIKAVQHILSSMQPSQAVSFNTHLKFFEDLCVLPSIQRMLLSRMVKGVSKQFALTNDLSNRIYVPPEVIMNLFKPLVNSKSVLEDIPFEQFFTMLALATGHHLGESFSFNLIDDVRTDTAEIHIKKFKFIKKSVWKPASPLLIQLVNAAVNSGLRVLNHGADPAAIYDAANIFGDEVKFASAMNNYLKQLPMPPGFLEKYNTVITHRILRRSYATILHTLQIPYNALCYVLNHDSRKAVMNYVVKMADSDVEFVMKNLHQNTQTICDHHQLIHNVCTWNLRLQVRSAKPQSSGDYHVAEVRPVMPCW